jgi:hypothetical protein
VLASYELEGLGSITIAETLFSNDCCQLLVSWSVSSNGSTRCNSFIFLHGRSGDNVLLTEI